MLVEMLGVAPPELVIGAVAVTELTPAAVLERTPAVSESPVPTLISSAAPTPAVVRAKMRAVFIVRPVVAVYSPAPILPLKAVQSALDSAPRLAALAVGILKVWVAAALAMLKSVPVVPVEKN
jgi:hypothetical protein